MKIGWFSFGVSSFIACYLERESCDKFIAVDVPDQHPDSYRFMRECEMLLGKKIELIRSDRYKSLSQVIEETGFVNSAHYAPCCTLLKKNVRKEWEKMMQEQAPYERFTYVWGYDRSEALRAERMKQTEPQHEHLFPLIKYGLSKEDCHGILKRMPSGPRRPYMYELGFSNNNCIGCVKQGRGSWNLTRRVFPEIFKQRAELERKIGYSCLNGTFLDELDPKSGNRNTKIKAGTQVTFLELMGL